MHPWLTEGKEVSAADIARTFRPKIYIYIHLLSILARLARSRRSLRCFCNCLCSFRPAADVMLQQAAHRVLYDKKNNEKNKNKILEMSEITSRLLLPSGAPWFARRASCL